MFAVHLLQLLDPIKFLVSKVTPLPIPFKFSLLSHIQMFFVSPTWTCCVKSHAFHYVKKSHPHLPHVWPVKVGMGLAQINADTLTCASFCMVTMDPPISLKFVTEISSSLIWVLFQIVTIPYLSKCTSWFNHFKPCMGIRHSIKFPSAFNKLLAYCKTQKINKVRSFQGVCLELGVITPSITKVM